MSLDFVTFDDITPVITRNDSINAIDIAYTNRLESYEHDETVYKEEILDVDGVDGWTSFIKASEIDGAGNVKRVGQTNVKLDDTELNKVWKRICSNRPNEILVVSEDSFSWYTKEESLTENDVFEDNADPGDWQMFLQRQIKQNKIIGAGASMDTVREFDEKYANDIL